MWFLYKEGVFWWLTVLVVLPAGGVAADRPWVALTIDTCDLKTGKVLVVTAVRKREPFALDPELGARKLTKYLGPDRDGRSDPGRPVVSTPGWLIDPAATWALVVTWGESGQAIPQEKVPLVLGMTLYEANPEVIQKTHSELPPQVRTVPQEQRP